MQENEKQLNEIPNGVRVGFLDTEDDWQPVCPSQSGRDLVRRVELNEAKLEYVFDDDYHLKRTRN